MSLSRRQQFEAWRAKRARVAALRRRVAEAAAAERAAFRRYCVGCAPVAWTVWDIEPRAVPIGYALDLALRHLFGWNPTPEQVRLEAEWRAAGVALEGLRAELAAELGRGTGRRG